MANKNKGNKEKKKPKKVKKIKETKQAGCRGGRGGCSPINDTEMIYCPSEYNNFSYNTEEINNTNILYC